MYQRNPEELTKYIRHKKGAWLWRPNSEDPYLYVTFNLQQLKSSYEKTIPFVKKFQEEFGVSEIEKTVVEKLTQILKEEWIEKAGLPIRFMDKHTNPSEIFKKNVCFIISTEMTVLEMQKESIDLKMLTLAAGFDYDKDGIKHSHFKIIRIPKLNSLDQIDNAIIQPYLHELGHALCELKHFQKYEEHDPGPFSEEMTCLDSVMSYWDTCPPILEEMYKEPKDRKPLKSKYPTILGPVDLAAAAEFIEDFKKRNLVHAAQIKQLGYDPYLAPESGKCHLLPIKNYQLFQITLEFLMHV